VFGHRARLFQEHHAVLPSQRDPLADQLLDVERQSRTAEPFVFDINSNDLAVLVELSFAG
jgi:hypothetical protein